MTARRPHPRSPLLRAIGCLAIGALFTVLIAWALAAFTRPSKSDIKHSPTRADISARGGMPVPPDWDPGTHIIYTGALGGFRYEMLSEMHWMGSLMGAMSGSMNRSTELVRVGWPLRCMEWRGGEYSSWPDKPGAALAPPRTGFAKVWNEGIELPLHPRMYPMQERRLPLRPIVPAFLVSTIVYAALTYAVVRVIHSLRVRRRASRGQCAACGYSIRGLSEPICPECGFPVAQPLADARSTI